MTGNWDKNGLYQDILWTTEPEMAVEDGSLIVPRMVPSKAANDRYNSVRRPITTEVTPTTTNTRIVPSGSSHILEEVPQAFISGLHSEDETLIRAEHSILSSLQITTTTRLFLVLGTNVGTGEKRFI
jgi:hybrid polyketide synthase/nonribosomal peptide synthetase ACE1